MKYINLKDGQTISGEFVKFFKGQYGVNMVLSNGEEEFAFTIKNAVLKNVIRKNIDKFVKGAEVTISRIGLEKNRYIIYKVLINGKDISDYDLTLEEIIDLLK